MVNLDGLGIEHYARIIVFRPAFILIRLGGGTATSAIDETAVLGWRVLNVGAYAA